MELRIYFQFEKTYSHETKCGCAEIIIREGEELSEDFTKIKNAKLKITEIASKWIDTLNTLEGEHMTVE